MKPPPAPASRFARHPDPSGDVDATWWPRSSDLGTELPDLLTALQPESWPISRVVYDPAAWSSAPPHLVVDGGTVRLDPYTSELPDTMYVYGADGIVLAVLVVPVEAGSERSTPGSAPSNPESAARSPVADETAVTR